MSLLATIATATIPLYNGYLAYKSAAFKVPEELAPHQLVPNDNTRNFATSCGITRDVALITGNFQGPPSGIHTMSYGNHSISGSGLAIIIDRSLIPNEQEADMTTDDTPLDTNLLAANVLMRREYAAIRNNTMLMIPSITAIAATAAATLGLKYLKPIPAFLLTTITAMGTRILASQFLEAKSDDEAIAHSSKEERQALLNLLKNDQKEVLKQGLQEQLWTSCALLEQPSLSSRIAKLEKALHTQ